MMNIKPIRNEQDYQNALKAIEPLFDKDPALFTAEESDFFEIMLTLIENYESKHYPIDNWADNNTPLLSVFYCLNCTKNQLE